MIMNGERAGSPSDLIQKKKKLVILPKNKLLKCFCYPTGYTSSTHAQCQLLYGSIKSVVTWRCHPTKAIELTFLVNPVHLIFSSYYCSQTKLVETTVIISSVPSHCAATWLADVSASWQFAFGGKMPQKNEDNITAWFCAFRTCFSPCETLSRDRKQKAIILSFFCFHLNKSSNLETKPPCPRSKNAVTLFAVQYVVTLHTDELNGTSITQVCA